jgi:dethiobiotin synthetase
MRQTFFITGTDTGVGKTVLTALLARHCRAHGVGAAALKPVASGGRADARVLQAALNGALTLDEITPWHFPAPLAPLLAARRENRQVRRAEVLAHIRKMRKRFEVLLVEGAGGLLSPLGDDFNSRDLIAALRAVPVIVGPNRIGVINQILLTIGALPRSAAARARVVLMCPCRPDAAAKTNTGLLGEFFDPKRILELPWLGRQPDAENFLCDARVRQVLDALAK